MQVGIVGAGISGLSAALILRREGHKVTIFEAGSRLDGRIFTYRFDQDVDSRTTNCLSVRFFELKDGLMRSLNMSSS